MSVNKNSKQNSETAKDFNCKVCPFTNCCKDSPYHDPKSIGFDGFQISLSEDAGSTYKVIYENRDIKSIRLSIRGCNLNLIRFMAPLFNDDFQCPEVARRDREMQCPITRKDCDKVQKFDSKEMQEHYCNTACSYWMQRPRKPEIRAAKKECEDEDGYPIDRDVCGECGTLLNFSDARYTDESTYAALAHVKCTHCGEINKLWVKEW